MGCRYQRDPGAFKHGRHEQVAGSPQAIQFGALVAIVVAEAFASAPAVILTSDSRDLGRLLEGEPEADRVRLIGV